MKKRDTEIFVLSGLDLALGEEILYHDSNYIIIIIIIIIIFIQGAFVTDVVFRTALLKKK